MNITFEMSYYKWGLETAYAVAGSNMCSHSEYAHRWPIRDVEPYPKTMQVNRNLLTDQRVLDQTCS